MNVFEDLIVELKEENLLEKTVIDSSKEAESRDVEDEAVDTQGNYEQTSDADDRYVDDEDHEPEHIASLTDDPAPYTESDVEETLEETSEEQPEPSLVPD